MKPINILNSIGLVFVLILTMATSGLRPSALPAPPMGVDTLTLLIYTETTGYDHNTRGSCVSLYEDIAAEENAKVATTSKWYEVVQDNNGSLFNSSLTPSNYYMVIFCNTSGDNGLNASQRDAFEDYIEAGGNYTGIHAATDTYRHSTANGNSTGTWDWYAENVAGKSVQQSPNHTSSSHVDTIFFFSTNYGINLPYLIIKKEEYYYWENGYEAPGFTTVAMVGETGGNSYDEPRDVAWARHTTYGGCVCGTSMGHSNQNFTDTDYGEIGFYFKELLRNFITEDCEVTLALGPPPEIVPGIEPVFLIPVAELPPPSVRWFKIYSLSGQLLEEGEIDERGYVPLLNKPGVYLYTMYNRAWKSGVYDN